MCVFVCGLFVCVKCLFCGVPGIFSRAFSSFNIVLNLIEMTMSRLFKALFNGSVFFEFFLSLVLWRKKNPGFWPGSFCFVLVRCRPFLFVGMSLSRILGLELFGRLALLIWLGVLVLLVLNLFLRLQWLRLFFLP